MDRGCWSGCSSWNGWPVTSFLRAVDEREREKEGERREKERAGERSPPIKVPICYLVECSISAGFTLQDSLLDGERLATCLLLLLLLLTQPGLQLLQLLLITPALTLQELHLHARTPRELGQTDERGCYTSTGTLLSFTCLRSSCSSRRAWRRLLSSSLMLLCSMEDSWSAELLHPSSTATLCSCSSTALLKLLAAG